MNKVLQFPEVQQHFKGMWIPMSEVPARSGMYLVSDGINFIVLRFNSVRDSKDDDTVGWYPKIWFVPTHWMDIPDCPIVR